MDGEKLIAARKRNGMSQEKAAEAIQVSSTTWQRWEKGETTPRGESLMRLKEVFNLTPEELGVVIVEREETYLSVHSTATLKEQFPHIQAFLTSDLTMCLLATTMLPFRGYHTIHQIFARALRDYDTMPIINLNHYINRREALCRMIGLPLATFNLVALEQGTKLPSAYAVESVKEFPSHHEIEGFLSQCASGIAACWELYRSSNASNTYLAFEGISRYIPILTNIAKQSSQYRKEALDLATRSALLKALLACDCCDHATSIQYAKDAVTLSKETKSASLQLSAYSKLAWAYFRNQQYTFALVPAQQSVALLEQVQSKISLRPNIRGGTYSTLALMQAINGLSPDTALGKATELDPGHDFYAFMEFSSSTMLLEAGLTQYYRGNQDAAMAWLTKRVDPETLETKIPQSERGRIQTINMMLLSSFRTRERDKEQSIRLWKEAIGGAKAIKSEERFHDALTAYERMELIWLGDADILNLRDLTKHW